MERIRPPVFLFQGAVFTPHCKARLEKPWRLTVWRAMTSRDDLPHQDITATRTKLFQRLDDLGISHRTVDHEAIMTVDEGREFKTSMPGGHSKNLFLKDKKGGRVFVTAHCDSVVDIVAIGRAVGSRGRLSFGKPELLMETLGVAPGSVTPFALMNARPEDLQAVIVDTRFFDHDPVWFHPLQNTGSTAISAENLLKFIRNAGFEPLVLDVANPQSAPGDAN